VVLAENLGITHGAVLKTLDIHLDAFQELNPLRFEIAKGELLPQGGRAKATRYALLNEDQSYLLLSFSRNTKRFVELKLNLVKAFGRFRREQQTTEDYLPFYHDFHDSVKALSYMAHQNGSKADEKLFHSNFNRLINKAFGLDAAQRPNLPPKSRAKVTAANIIVGDIVQRCIEASDIYAATPPQRQAARKCSHNYYGTTFAFSGYYKITIYKTIAYEFILRIDARQIFNMG